MCVCPNTHGWNLGMSILYEDFQGHAVHWAMDGLFNETSSIEF